MLRPPLNIPLLSLKDYSEVLLIAEETIMCLCAKSPLTLERLYKLVQSPML